MTTDGGMVFAASAGGATAAGAGNNDTSLQNIHISEGDLTVGGNVDMENLSSNLDSNLKIGKQQQSSNLQPGESICVRCFGMALDFFLNFRP